MRVYRNNYWSLIGDCEAWLVSGDPLPPPNGPRFNSPDAHEMWCRGWSAATCNEKRALLDPTKADA